MLIKERGVLSASNTLRLKSSPKISAIFTNASCKESAEISVFSRHRLHSERMGL